MKLSIHHEHHDPAPALPPGATRWGRAVEHATAGGRVYAVQRIGAVAVALVLFVFGLLGLLSGLPFLSTRGQQVLGLSSNGLLSVVSIAAAVVLTAAVSRGPRLASTAMIAFGVLFLVSTVVNLAVLRTSLNVFAFAFSNVAFSIVVGLLLLTLGCYGRVSGNLPSDSPYAHARPPVTDPPESYPSTPAEFAAEAAMREAEIAVVEHYATPEQHRRVQAMAAAHTRAERRRIWLEADRGSGR